MLSGVATYVHGDISMARVRRRPTSDRIPRQAAGMWGATVALVVAHRLATYASVKLNTMLRVQGQ